MKRRLLITLALPVVALGVALGFLLIAASVEGRREATLPAPQGSFAVGRMNSVWQDDAAHPSRELLVWIWYPATSPIATATRSEYFPAPWAAAIREHAPLVFRAFLNRDPARVRVHSATDADVSAAQATYPVVIMRGGLSAMIGSYTTLAESLASFGYVVVGFDAPARTALVVFPDGRIVERSRANNAELVSGEEQTALLTRLVDDWTTDIAFALGRLDAVNRDGSGRLAGRLDLTKLGLFGHSLGGATSLQFCHDDPRCRAVIDIDGLPLGSVAREGVVQPVMFLLSDHGDLAATSEGARVDNEIRTILARAPPDGRTRIALRGADHFLFGDGALINNRIAMRTLQALGVHDLDGARQVEITNFCVHTFFDVHLKGAPRESLARGLAAYPEVMQ